MQVEPYTAAVKSADVSHAADITPTTPSDASSCSQQYSRYGRCLHTQKEISEDVKKQKHTTGGIPRWSPTLVLVARFSAYVWQSGRDAQFSLTYGRMYLAKDLSKYDLVSKGLHT